MLCNKDVGGIEHEVLTMFMELENYFKHIIRRLNDMNKYKNSGSVGCSDLEDLKDLENETRKSQENIYGELNQLMKDFFKPQQDSGILKRSRRCTIQDMKFAKEKIEKATTNLQNMNTLLDELEAKFRKYFVPKRNVQPSSPESIDRYLERLREFMQATWKEEAKKCREKEQKSLIEWMVKLAESERHEKFITLKALRGVLIIIGMQISCFLIEYFLIMSVSAESEEIEANLLEVESIIRCLSVEENSIVINAFLSVVKLFERMTRMTSPSSEQDANRKPKKKKKKDDSLTEKENDVLAILSSLSLSSHQNAERKRVNKINMIKKGDSQLEKESNVLSLLSRLFAFPDRDEEGKLEKRIKIFEKDDLQMEKENDVLHMIIIEILRLEVGFCCPDLPMMVSNEVFLAMGNHLTENVFEDKLYALGTKIDGLKTMELQSVGDKDSVRKTTEQVLDVGVKEIWHKLDLTQELNKTCH